MISNILSKTAHFPFYTSKKIRKKDYISLMKSSRQEKRNPDADNKILYNINLMKKFRSSKALKPVEPQVKQQANLRMKVKILQEQIQMLQKSNLNIFIPITEHAVHENTDYQSIINRLRQQVAGLEHEAQGHKYHIKKLERDKEQLKKEYSERIQQLMENNKQLSEQNQELKGQLAETQQNLNAKMQQCQELNQTIIEKNVELKFLHEDLHEEKIKSAGFKNKFSQLQRRVTAVSNSQNIHNSLEIRCICILKEQYDSLKAVIDELKAKIQALLDAQKREKVTLGVRKSDIGEQIVRLKKNIDAQLGLSGESKHSQEFLKVYRGTNELFQNLIKQCRVSSAE